MNNNEYQKSLLAITELQEKLYEISESSYESIEEYLKMQKENFLKDKPSLQRLLLVINSSMNATPHQLIQYQKLIHFLKDILKQQFSSDELFNIFNENKAALLFLISNDLIDASSLFASNRHYEELQFYFAPEILVNPNYKKWRIYRKDFKKYLLEDMDPKLHIESRSKLINPDPISIAIRDDDLESFQNVISRADSEDSLSSTKIKYSFFEPFTFVCEPITLQLLTLIEYASFFGSVKIVKYLLANEVELFKFRGKFAIAGGNAEIIHLLEERDVKFDTFDCLAVAIQFQHSQIFRYLLENYDMKYDINLIKTCVKYDNISLLEEILKETEKSDNDNEAFVVSIRTATRNGNFDLILYLLDQMKERKITLDESLMIKLLNKACKYGFLNIIQYFIDELKVPYRSDSFKGLYKASKSGKLPVVQYLCNLDGVNLNYIYSVSKDTPFTIAALRGHYDIVKFLFNTKGVDVNHTIYNGQNAVFRAAEGQHYELLKFLYENLPNSDNIINIVDMTGFTLLSFASQFDCAEIVKYLIEQKGFDVNSPNLRPLLYAIQNNCVSVMKYYLTLDNCKLVDDESGETAIHTASFYQIEGILKLLIESKKIDINAKNKRGIYFNFYL